MAPARRRAVLAAISAAVTALIAAPAAGAATWSAQPVAIPSGAVGGELTGVSCVSASSCEAVGEWQDSSHHLALLIDRWDGTSWSVQSAPVPAGSGLSALSAVSCTADGACTAGGFAVGADNQPRAVAERFNGTSWSLQTVAQPAGDTAAALTGVSCSSPQTCTAVGNTASVRTLAERWNGTVWTVQTTPAPPGQLAFPGGVSCPSDAGCAMAGNVNDTSGDPPTGFTEQFGGSWTLGLSGPSAGPLDAVSCSAPGTCTAVGFNQLSAVTQPFAYRLNGSEWTSQSAASAPGASSTGLSGVSCPASALCVAVGGTATFGSGNVAGTLAESWDGSRWTIESTPEATLSSASGSAAVLDADSCLSSGVCEAVGRDQSGMPLAAVRGSASALPVVRTKGPSDVTPTVATLNGAIDAQGASITACRFAWGLTHAYGHTAPCRLSKYSGPTFTQVHAKITELKPGTAYDYRLIASTAAGTARGSNWSFTTPRR